ncbi:MULTISPECIES: helix-turn-helix transcriptional regulator [Paraburkholderia]|jgi:prophage regulatory protein|uniref:AlpA family transcriptional regulator n=1 Tax=Paraburkholderia fungorum TaxID=134537 RepID=A0AAP5QGB0_9BURK|nr:AlpA family transcriptional regulator [Paraburkholderia fungorum]MBU7436183.1 AlpA family transcriptional regulator [Paraburkholderia fungorum]MDT8843676.1 AlpA family transcriptional regulator [Paraburkholderia fungorum]PZR45662.1 MAG: hypothetical protein DI523_20250 [Paraburkholderia fungorum]
MTANVTFLKKILRMKQLVLMVGLGKSTVYDYLNPKSPRHDPTFPKPVKLGASAVGWIDHEVTAWLESRIAASRQDDANPEARHATQSPRNLSSQGEK